MSFLRCLQGFLWLAHLGSFGYPKLSCADGVNLDSFFALANASDAAQQASRHPAPSHIDALLLLLFLRLLAAAATAGPRCIRQANDERLRGHLAGNELTVDAQGKIDETCLQSLKTDGRALWHRLACPGEGDRQRLSSGNAQRDEKP